MPQQTPDNPNDSFTLPPPPPLVEDSPFDERTLADKKEYIDKYTWQAFPLSLASIFCCGMIGIYSFNPSNSLVQNIDYYQVSKDKRGMATAAKIIFIVGLVLWIIALLVRFLLGGGF
jgi:hypothetical protein